MGRRRNAVWLATGPFILASILVACGESEGGTDPTSTALSELSPVLTQEQVLIAEAADLCPEELIEPCTEAYVVHATGSLPAGLCVTDEGLWFFETPAEDAAVGDVCQLDAAGTIRAIVGGR